MAKNPNYQAEGDPSEFEPDFNERPEPFGKPIPKLLACFDDLPAGSHIVDIAGGYGRYALPLAERGHRVTIIDTHQASLDEANKRAQRLTPEQGSITTINADVIREDMPELGQVDATLCAGFIHHLAEEGVRDLFDTMVTATSPGGRVILEFSTNKDRRNPDGSPILVSGAPEHNLTYEQGMELLKELYSPELFSKVTFGLAKLYERQPDFWYDADMITAVGVKK